MLLTSPLGEENYTVWQWRQRTLVPNHILPLLSSGALSTCPPSRAPTAQQPWNDYPSGAFSMPPIVYQFIFLPPYCVFPWLLEYWCSVIVGEASAKEDWYIPIPIFSSTKLKCLWAQLSQFWEGAGIILKSWVRTLFSKTKCLVVMWHGDVFILNIPGIFQLPRLIWNWISTIKEFPALRHKCQKVLVWSSVIKGHFSHASSTSPVASLWARLYVTVNIGCKHVRIYNQ